jgi:ribonuclease HI
MRQLIAYTDGARRGNGDTSCGVFFPYGLEGKGIGGLPVYTYGEYTGKGTNNEAEYSGLILALKHALTYSYTSLKVFSDSQLIVKQMRGIYRVESSSLRPLYEKAYTLACQLDFEINWVPREQNTEADRICNEVLDRHQGKTN